MSSICQDRPGFEKFAKHSASQVDKITFDISKIDESTGSFDMTILFSGAGTGKFGGYAIPPILFDVNEPVHKKFGLLLDVVIQNQETEEVVITLEADSGECTTIMLKDIDLEVYELSVWPGKPDKSVTGIKSVVYLKNSVFLEAWEKLFEEAPSWVK